MDRRVGKASVLSRERARGSRSGRANESPVRAEADRSWSRAGLADFPEAAVHLSSEEYTRLGFGHWRYSAAQFAHGPRWVTHPLSTGRWYGAEARPLPALAGSEAFLIPLFGHTLGHRGVAVRHGGRWLLHVGDAYYPRVELSSDEHPVSALAAQRADDDALRRDSLEAVRRIAREHGAAVETLGYHDFTEFRAGSVPDEESEITPSASETSSSPGVARE